jgi:hypothetical protein
MGYKLVGCGYGLGSQNVLNTQHSNAPYTALTVVNQCTPTTTTTEIEQKDLAIKYLRGKVEELEREIAQLKRPVKRRPRRFNRS